MIILAEKFNYLMAMVEMLDNLELMIIINPAIMEGYYRKLKKYVKIGFRLINITIISCCLGLKLSEVV